MPNNITQNITNFCFELDQLTRVMHSGSTLLGDKTPKSVAEHSLRAAQIAFIIAKMENYKNPHEVCTMLVFHDIGECRIGDIHKVANRYLEADERRAVEEQTKPLDTIGEEILKLWEGTEYQQTEAGIIAKDADYLEAAFNARSYVVRGFVKAQDWIDNVEKRLKTTSAKACLKQLNNADPYAWWEGLKKF